jgi:EcsC protein family
MSKFETYDLEAIKGIAKHYEDPYWFDRLIKITGKPIDLVIEGAKKISEKKTEKVLTAVNDGIQSGLTKAIKGVNKLHTEEKILMKYNKIKDISISSVSEIKNLPLKDIDQVANQSKTFNKVLATGGGVVFGGLASAGFVAPLAIPLVVTADLGSTLTLLIKHISQISTSFGYSSKEISNIRFILEAMTPIQCNENGGYLPNKVNLQKNLRFGADFIKKNQDNLFELIGKNEAPKIIQLLHTLAQRLGISLTEKEFAMLIPVIGAIGNGMVNNFFLESAHQTAHNYFRKMTLEERYGKNLVAEEIGKQRELIRKEKELSKSNGLAFN